jgi:hypothetical protein
MEWLIPRHEEVPTPPDGYVVSFVPFLKRGLTTPRHQFLLGLLHHYKIEHIVAFVALCEGYLGIEPHFELWRHFFSVSLLKKREKNGPDLLVPMGCTCIHLRSN